MKKYGALIAFVVAIGFGVLAVMLANQWMSKRGMDVKQAIAPETPMAKIVVASKDIDIGTPLTAETLSLADWPKVNIPKGAFETIAALDGRVAVVRLVAGEPLLAAELAAPGSGAGLVALIPNGMRALSIRVDEVIGVSGFVLPNTFVDVLSTEPNQGGSQGKSVKVKTILERIKVLAIAQETFTEEGKAKIVRTVTLEVSPEQGEKLVQHISNGSVHLALRNPLDTQPAVVAVKEPPPPSPPDTVTVKPTVRKQVLRKRVTRRPAGGPVEVDVIKGKEREQIQFKSKSSTERT